jgi:hypothetical protein
MMKNKTEFISFSTEKEFESYIQINRFICNRFCRACLSEIHQKLSEGGFLVVVCVCVSFSLAELFSIQHIFLDWSCPCVRSKETNMGISSSVVGLRVISVHRLVGYWNKTL